MEMGKERVAAYMSWKLAYQTGTTTMDFGSWMLAKALPEPVNCPHPFEEVHISGRSEIQCGLCGAKRNAD